MKNKRAFTLIELVSVLVILAILALIVTPLVLNIIRKARTAADKRSIDAYGRSIELAIADYLLENGSFPTSVEELQVEYSGDRVECSTTRLNSDSSVYLAECTVNGRVAAGYTYGKEETVTYKVYSVGDEVSYNNVDYYVIKDSSASEANVTLLKKIPLTTEEVNTYGGVGTENNVVNKYQHTSFYNQQQDYIVAEAIDVNGYGGMAYYESPTCYYLGDGVRERSGCLTDYAQSEIKQVVDAWATANIPNSLVNARLITFDELVEDFGFEFQQVGPTEQVYKYTEPTPVWLYNNNCPYWTMSQYNDNASEVWCVGTDGTLRYSNVSNSNCVRPVITISKTAL